MAPPATPTTPPRGAGSRGARRPRGSSLEHLRARLELPVSRRATGLLDGRHRTVLQGHGQDFDDLSLYTPGDDVGDIDWKSSARAGIPVIKRFVRQSDLTLVLAMDTGRTMAATSAGGEPKSEVALHAATLVAQIARLRGDRVALVAADAGRIVQLPPRGGTAHLELVLRHAARAYGLDAPPSDVGRVLLRVLGTTRRRALVVLVTDGAHPGPEHAAALRTVRVRHEVMVVAVADADPLAPATAGSRDVSDQRTVPAWLPGRGRAQAAARAARAARVAQRAAMLRRMDVPDIVVPSSDAVVPALVDLLVRSRRARR